MRAAEWHPGWIVLGVIGIFVFIAIIGRLITDSTFGARCDRIYGVGTLEAEACVRRLAKGWPLEGLPALTPASAAQR